MSKKSIRSILVEHHNGVMEIVEASNTGQITGVQEDELAKNNTDQALADINQTIKKAVGEMENWEDNHYAGFAKTIDGGKALEATTNARNNLRKKIFTALGIEEGE